MMLPADEHPASRIRFAACMTFGSLLAERRALSAATPSWPRCVGLLEDGGPLVAVVHGVAGAGKSALLRAFAAEARRRHVSSTRGRASNRTPQGFAAAVGDRCLERPVVL